VNYYQYGIISLLAITLTFNIFNCTGIRLIAADKSVVYARTLEFGQDLKSALLFIPRQHAFVGTSPFKGYKGLKWKSRYAVLGANALGVIGLIDGINEKGLAGGLFYFPDYASYQKIDPTQAASSIASAELLTWILTTCATVKEVKHMLPQIKVSTGFLKQQKSIEPIHAIIHDPQGNSLVIEYTAGHLNIYDNPLGVITNSPAFDWHVTNLRNYTNLSPVNVPKKKLNDLVLRPFGQGSGWLGLPGDFTPPSRFVRAVAFSQSVLKPLNAYEGVLTAFRLLNLFDIPKGVIQDYRPGKIYYDQTQWTSAVDLHNKRYYFHTSNNRQIHMVDLLKLANSALSVLSIDLHNTQKIHDLTSDFKSIKPIKRKVKPMTKPLHGLKVAIVVSDGFEQVEMTKPRAALEQAGAITSLIAPALNKVKSWHHNQWDKEFPVDIQLDQANPINYDALLLPGGVISPDHLRILPKAISFIKSFVDTHKPIAAICHGPWTLINAHAVKGRTVTSWPSLQIDLENAGAHWIDKEVVRDDLLVTSRKPDDIPAFNEAMIDLFLEAIDSSQTS
jgi:choloylglycine hydrolase